MLGVRGCRCNIPPRRLVRLKRTTLRHLRLPPPPPPPLPPLPRRVGHRNLRRLRDRRRSLCVWKLKILTVTTTPPRTIRDRIRSPHAVRYRRCTSRSLRPWRLPGTLWVTLPPRRRMKCQSSVVSGLPRTRGTGRGGRAPCTVGRLRAARVGIEMTMF